MDVWKIRAFFSKSSNEFQTVLFMLKKINSALIICNFYHQIRDSGAKNEKLIEYIYVYHDYKED